MLLSEFSLCDIPCGIPEFLMGHDFLAVCVWRLLCFLVLFDCDVDGKQNVGNWEPWIWILPWEFWDSSRWGIKQVELAPLNIYPERGGWQEGRQHSTQTGNGVATGRPRPQLAALEECQSWRSEDGLKLLMVWGPTVLFPVVFCCASVASLCRPLHLCTFVSIYCEFLFSHLFFKSSPHQLQYIREFVTS